MSAFRFFCSIRIFPGNSLDIGERSTPVSVGVRGAHITLGHGQVRETAGLPGTRLSYMHTLRQTHGEAARAENVPIVTNLPPERRPLDIWRVASALIVFLAIVAITINLGRFLSH